MNLKSIQLFFAILALCSFTALQAATINFTGAGDGTSWEDPANWDSGSVPTFADDVVLNGTDNVTISTAGIGANSLYMRQDAVLTINATGVLSLNFFSYNGDLVRMENRSLLVITGAMTILNAPEDGIDMNNQSEIINNGFLNIVEPSFEGISMDNGSAFTNNGTFFARDGSIEMNDNTDVFNYGSMTLTDECDAIELDDNANFQNDGSITIMNGDCDGIDQDDSGSRFLNNGTLYFSMGSFADNSIEVDDGFFTNSPTGTITVVGPHDGIDMQSDGRLDNDGIINIVVNGNSTGDDGIDMECGSRIRNYNVINIDVPSGGGNTIELECSSARFRNEACGVVNMTSQSAIEVVSGAVLRNEGVLATVFSGTHDNFGTINNQNVINAPNGFTAAPNPVVGPGSVSMVGAVPAQSACNINIGSIGCAGTTTYDPTQQMYTQTANGCFYASPYTSDEISHAFQQLCGNGEIYVRVANFVGQGWGGIMMREDLSPGSKKVQLMTNQSQLARREVRVSTNGPAFPAQFPAYGHQWLRLVRNGDYFQGFISQNGVNWQFVMNTYVPMSSCIYIGLVSTNYNQFNSMSTVMFDNVFFSNAPLIAPEETVEIDQIDVELTSSSDNFEVYPNPTSGEVTIEMNPTLEGEVEVVIMNNVGQVVKNLQLIPAEMARQEVSLEGLPNGMYFFDMIDENGNRQTKKVVLNAR